MGPPPFSFLFFFGEGVWGGGGGGKGEACESRRFLWLVKLKPEKSYALL